MKTVAAADSDLLLQVMEGFRPSLRLQGVINRIISSVDVDTAGGGGDSNSNSNNNNENLRKNGICLHQRAGVDWKEHCKRWMSLTQVDGIYRGNCHAASRLKEVVLSRILDQGQQDRWVYYCGDFEEIPYLLQSSFKYKVHSRRTLLPNDAEQIIYDMKPGQPVRDLWALVDFSVCRDLDHFIGHSVSTFSAIQIALRQGNQAYWYNSQSIPLSTIWRVYQIPIVYTYTEKSEMTGQLLLKASIASVRKHMPHNRIHVLYHGSSDVDFYVWLKEQRVTIHQHDPKWAPIIEVMRQYGSVNHSHLFAHSGNYLGTWQRIDIPLFLDTEYVLFLDADTIVSRPFTLADFGPEISRSLAMSSEYLVTDQAVNAGITLMNVPHLRETYTKFLNMIAKHTHSPIFQRGQPSDQGAYLEFYRPKFLSRCFNFKPYYNYSVIPECDGKPFVIHFHGAKPHDYFRHILGDKCGKVFRHLCTQAVHEMNEPLCLSFQMFARALQSVDEYSYCDHTMSTLKQSKLCNNVLKDLATQSTECTDVRFVINAHNPGVDVYAVDGDDEVNCNYIG